MEERKIKFSLCHGPITTTKMVVLEKTIPEFKEFINSYTKQMSGLFIEEIRLYHLQNKEAFKYVKNRNAYMIGGECVRRGKDFLKNIYMLPIDLDNIPYDVTLEDINEKCEYSGYEFVSWTTFSHLVFLDKNNRPLPKFRVYLILKEPVFPDKFHILPRLHQDLAESLFIPSWIDKKSYVLSQPMFLPVKFKKESYGLL